MKKSLYIFVLVMATLIMGSFASFAEIAATLVINDEIISIH